MGGFGRLQKCRRRCMDKTDHEPHYGHVLPDELVAGPETRPDHRTEPWSDVDPSLLVRM